VKFDLRTVLALALLYFAFKGNLPNIFPSTQKATAVTYVYEKDSGGIPNPVQAAFDKLNRDKDLSLVATFHEVDSTDGSGEIPDQYKVPVAAARESGLPAAVATAGEKVLKTVKAPQTEADVMEVLK